MSLEIVEFIPLALDAVQKGNFVKLGHVKLRVSDELMIVMEAMQGKDGGVWFRVPNLKMGDQFKPAYEFNDNEFTKNVSKQIKDEFKAKYM